MKISIVYNSKTGFTKKYAEWIAEELGCAALPYKGFDIESAGEDDLLVFCGRIAAGKIENLNNVKKLLAGRENLSLIVAAVGATNPGASETINKMWAGNLSEAELETIPHFFLPGGIAYEKLGFGDKSLLKMVAKMLKNKKDKTEEEAEFEKILGGSFDNTAKEYIRPLVEYVRERTKGQE